MGSREKAAQRLEPGAPTADRARPRPLLQLIAEPAGRAVSSWPPPGHLIFCHA